MANVCCSVHDAVGGDGDKSVLFAGRQLAFNTVVSLFRHYTHERALLKGRSLHDYIINRGFDQETFLGNLVVQMYGRCGSVAEAKKAFDRIQEPNVFSWTIMVAAYAENGYLQEARKIFDAMTEKNVVSWTAMVSNYAQNGYLQEARKLFDEMPVRTAVPWNAMIAGYAQNGHCDEALVMYRRMRQEGVKPTESTFVSTVDACATVGLLEAGRLVHSNAAEMGFHTAEKVGNALVNMYGCCGCWEDAKKAFDDMPEQNVIAWTALLVAYARSSKVEEAKATFDKTPVKSFISWSAMVGAYAQNGHSKEALLQFRLMDLEGERPDGVTFITTLYVCGNLSAIEVGRIIYDDIVGTHLETDVTVVTALLDMFSKCGSLSQAKSLFDRMPLKDMVMWSSMVAACAHNGQWLMVLDTYYYMLLNGVKPNKVTLMSVLSACSHAGLLRVALEQFTSMREEYGCEPEYRHYVCMVDTLARAGQVKEAEDLIETMPFEPDGLSWRTLLSACNSSSGAGQGSRAAENVFELDPEHGAPYILLSNLHSEK
ncbi:pentatricopeptide repeat-containing protein At2g21090-like [Selaginella moellendorffii]|uniref:pentatricopeptide repeat-containing protein At2g21090-like n=1 Tax=Selaginella moellendorffii TaxID=88036 RepID=UPI000D1CF966|nr:pentatricopeptide repeat-containing protein At2g21090-like [Selaginella moellendorffii]|eukprot:XP_024539757.1 pentatricopeptide repeat-containing protein At2g21090-like [Selaginella moellendorffii]